MNRREFVEQSLAGIGTIALGRLVASAQEHGDWRDPELKNLQVTATSPRGESYEAEIPDTVELTDYANRAINMGTRILAPEWDYEQFFWTYMEINPPVLELGHGGLLNNGPKMVEALPMLRMMTGSTYNIEQDGHAMGSILHVTGLDGLCYHPVKNRPWAFFEETTRKIGKPYCDIFGEGRQLLAYARWYQNDGNPLWRKLAERKIRTLRQMTIKKSDTVYFRLSRGYTPWDQDRTKGPVVSIADHRDYHTEGMVGAPAAYISGFIPQAGALWYRLANMEEALELGGGLARYLYLYGDIIDPDTGKFLADHETHITHSLLGNLSWATAENDKSMIEWVRKGYEYNVHARDPDGTGIVYGKEACSVSDIIGVGIMLSQAGVHDYWENVDRWLRNTFLNLQRTDAIDIKSLPVTHPDLQQGFEQPSDAVDRVVGVWQLNLEYPLESISCCNGNCSRILYYLWNNILTSKGDELRVNLLLNRASPWADVDSWIPNVGRVRIRMKAAKHAVLVRIPAWTDRGRVSCKVNGTSRSGTWAGNYLNVGTARTGDSIVIDFPIYEKKVSSARDGVLTLRGNTVVDADRAGSYPIFRQAKYRADAVPTRKVRRFVSAEEFTL